MDDDKILLSHIDDCIVRSGSELILTSGAFLDLRQQSLVLNHCKHYSDCRCVLYGGYDESERVIPLFLPYYLELSSYEDVKDYFSKDESENPLCAIRVEKDNFSSLSHRDYLGALMALGIKRETIGDIIVNEDGADIIVKKTISDFILNEFKSAGNATLKSKIISFDELNIVKSNYYEKIISVSSMRLDNIIGACFNLSRAESSRTIESGLVFVNGMQICKTDKKTFVGNKIVLRGKGKTVLSEERGTSKKGRIFIAVNVYE